MLEHGGCAVHGACGARGARGAAPPRGCSPDPPREQANPASSLPRNGKSALPGVR